MRKKTVAMLTAFILLVICGCQATPEKSIVTSKNDGIFEAALANTPAPTAIPENTGAVTDTQQSREAVTYSDSFENANGNIRYELNLTAPIVQTALPVVQVRPMEITPELAKQTAQAVLGDDTEFYKYSGQHTKAELEQIILDLRQDIADWDGLVEQCGGKEDEAALLQEMLEDDLASAESLYDQAPETLERTLCDWQFHSSDYYSDDLYGYNSSYQSIKASATVNGIPFVFNASNREDNDLRDHSISISEDSELTDTSTLTTGASGSAATQALQEKAVELANAMGLGQWRVLTESENAVAGYSDTVILTRLYDGVPITWHDSPSESETAYGPFYQYEQLRIAFRDNALVDFLYQGALEKVSTVNENIQTLPFADILAAAKAQMRLRGTTNPVTGETVSAAEDGSYEKIVVDSVELGLTRVLVKDNSTDYYLVPTYTFYGTSTSYNADGTAMDFSFYDEVSGQTITFPNESMVELAVINAVDGSAVDTNLGY